MKKQLFFLLMCLISALSGWAGVQTLIPAILPWGADEPWKMKYVMQPDDSYSEPANDGVGHEWTQLGYDDSGWLSLTGPMANGYEENNIFFFRNFTWDGENNTFNLRRTFTLNAVNPSGYTFATWHDDDINVYINGQLVVESSNIQGIERFLINASYFQVGTNQLAIKFHAGPFTYNFLDYALFAGNEADNGQYDGLDINGLRYWFNDDGETARVVGINEGVQVANIPSSITVKGKKYLVTTISWNAFAESELTSVSIPHTITKIRENAFYHCNVERVDITDLEAWCKIDFEGDDYDYGGNPLCTGDGKLYLNNKRILNLEIPESITEIKRFTFRGGNFSSLTIPSTVTQIGEAAFKGCSTLRTATINNVEETGCSLTRIASSAFCDCSSMQSINFTEYPTYIGDGAFARCSSLTSIELNDNLTTIRPRTFFECNNLSTINIPSCVTSIGEGAFESCGSLSIDLILPEGLTTVGNRAFVSCNKIKSLILPNTLTTIGDEAFTFLANIRTLYIPSSVTEIGEMAFVELGNAVTITVAEDNPNYDSRSNCNALIETVSGKLLAGCRNTIIVEGVKSLEKKSLAGQPNSIIVLSNTVETIKENAFGWCPNLRTLVLGSGITDIGPHIHYNSGPSDVYCYTADVPLTDGDAFTWSSLGTLHVPAGLIEKYKKTSPWNLYTNYVPITGDEQFTYDVYLSALDNNNIWLSRNKGRNVNVTVEGTFHKDGKWNMLCLPFSVTEGQRAEGGHPLHDATIMKLDVANSRFSADGCLDMQFGRTNHMEAGIPYLVKWEKRVEWDEGNVVNPVFKSVTLSHTEPIAVTFTNEQGSGLCRFVGQFSPFQVTEENIKVIVDLDSENQFSYLQVPNTLHSCLAHFEIPTTEDDKTAMTSSLLSFIGDANGEGWTNPIKIKISGLWYELDEENKTAEVISTQDEIAYSGEIDIPETITYIGEDYTVTSIGRDAFISCESLYSVVLPNKIKRIEQGAFAFCSSLKSVELPDGLEFLGHRAFSDCTGLEWISIPSSVKRIREGALCSCPKLERVYITDLEAWCRIDFSIVEDWWNGNPLSNGSKLYLNNKRITDLVIPETITEIKDYAFIGGKFTSLTIPNTVTTIGAAAFRGCSTLRTATIKNAEGSCELESIGSDAFCDCSSMQSINFTEYPTYIGDGAFARCSSLTSIELNDNLTTIRPRTFYECSSLTTINIPSSVTTIGDGAFSDCGSLSIDLILPEGLTTIGNGAFIRCSKVERLHFPNTLATIGDEAFHGLSGIKSLYIPSSVTSIGQMAFTLLSNVLSIVVSEDNPRYDSRNNCNSIIETRTGKLLAGCRNTIIPDEVTSIERYALAWLPRTIFVVPNSVEEIKEGAFSNANIDGYYCFKTLVLGDGVTDIGPIICGGGGFPSDVYCYATSVPTADGAAFDWDTQGGHGMGTLHVPAESIEEYKATAPWNNFSNYVPITGDEQFTYDLYLSAAEDNSVMMNYYNDKDVNATIGRTFHKDGKWNTLCLPFSMTAEQIESGDNPLRDATIVKMEPASSGLKADGTLDIMFVRTAIIEAGKPYLVRWKEGDDLVDPTFKSVHLSCMEPTAIEFDNEQGTDPCKFVGQFSPFKVTDENIDRIVQLSPDGQPYYSPEPETLYSSHAHFEIPGLIKSSNFSYRGDVNNDGEVDLSDAIMVTYYSLHEVPSNFNESAADLNGDGDIDLSDAIIIIYISLGVR